MQTLYFTDNGDGYYQVDVEDGADPPAWTLNLNPSAIVPPVPPDPVQQVKNQIIAIERETQMNRAIREGWLLLVEREAMREYSTDLATVQAGLYAGNLAYHKVKDIDNQIAALRAQIGEL